MKLKILKPKKDYQNIRIVCYVIAAITVLPLIFEAVQTQPIKNGLAIITIASLLVSLILKISMKMESVGTIKFGRNNCTIVKNGNRRTLKLSEVVAIKISIEGAHFETEKGTSLFSNKLFPITFGHENTISVIARNQQPINSNFFLPNEMAGKYLIRYMKGLKKEFGMKITFE